MAISDDKKQSVYAQLTARIETVKLYSAGATVTRIAEFPLIAGELPEHVEITGLPLALDDSSVRVRVEVEQGTAPLACDVRIGLAVPPPQETPNPPDDEEIRAATAQVRQIKDVIALIENEIAVLRNLHVPDRPDAEPGKAPPPSPMSARLALANFSDEQIRGRIQEKRENIEKLRQAEQHLADLQQQQYHASTARDARPHELRKTVIVRLSSDGTPSTEQLPRLVVEYFVPGARWTPTYVCRLNSTESSANIAVRALICQRTGEDWSGVRLELSTAEPMAWCELPELSSLRIGRAQPVLRKSGWRRPPIGAEFLFEDFDRQKDAALSAVPKHPLMAEFSSVCVPPLPNLVLNSELAFDLDVGALPNNITDSSLDDVWQDITSSSKPSHAVALRHQFSPFANKLIQVGYVNTEQMQEALVKASKLGRPVTGILESMTGRQLSPNLLRQYKKQQLFELEVLYGVEALDLEEVSSHNVGQLIDQLIPIDICSRYRLVPISKKETQPPVVLVAMVDPDNLDAQDDLTRILGPQGIALQRMVITFEDYQTLISLYRDEKLERARQEEFQRAIDVGAAVDVTQDLQGFDTLQNAADEVQEVDLKGAEDAPVINFVNRILAKALQEEVSHIHVEPQENDLRVRFQKDGGLREAFDPLPKKISSAVAARFKIMAKLDIGQRQLPQVGKIRRMYQGRKVEFFVKILPTRYGEKIVLDLQAPALVTAELWMDEDATTNLLAYGVMRMGAADDPTKRGKLSLEQQEEAFLEILKRQNVVVRFNVVSKVQKAVSDAQSCLLVALPPGGIDVRQVAGSFDYAYSADGRVDVPSDGQFHSVALTSKSTDVDLRYIVVPREDTNAFRIAQLCNPLQAPLLAGPADVYVNGEYILSTYIATVPPKGKMELGLGVEQAIKVARNTSYDEVRSGETIVAFNELHHKIKIDITNLLPRAAKIEVRERLPIPQESAKVDVQIDRVTPNWEPYQQQERSAPIQGGYRWQVEVPAKGEKALSVDYTIKTFVDSELIGGNRREA